MNINDIVAMLLKAAPIHELFSLRARLVDAFGERKQVFNLKVRAVTQQLDLELQRRLGTKAFFWVRYDEGVCGHRHYEITAAVECLGQRDTVKTDAEIIKLTPEGAFRFRDGYFLQVQGRDELDLMAEFGEGQESMVTTLDHQKVLADSIIVAAQSLEPENRSDVAARLCLANKNEILNLNRMLGLAVKDVEANLVN